MSLTTAAFLLMAKAVASWHDFVMRSQRHKTTAFLLFIVGAPKDGRQGTVRFLCAL
jgi:hypothetical protein